MNIEILRELLDATKQLLPSENYKKLTIKELENIVIKNKSDKYLINNPSQRCREFTTYHNDESALRLKKAWDAAKVEIEHYELFDIEERPFVIVKVHKLPLYAAEALKELENE